MADFSALAFKGAEMNFRITAATLAVSAVALLAGTQASFAGLLWGNGTAKTASLASQSLRDGSFTGPAVRQYYGYVQARVNIQNGRIASIKILRYPSEYYTSVYINTHALPMLEAEVIQAQSVQVSGISGATLTSAAFLMSMEGALQKASA